MKSDLEFITEAVEDHHAVDETEKFIREMLLLILSTARSRKEWYENDRRIREATNSTGQPDQESLF